MGHVAPTLSNSSISLCLNLLIRKESFASLIPLLRHLAMLLMVVCNLDIYMEISSNLFLVPMMLMCSLLSTG